MRKLRITALSALLLMAGLAAQAQSTKQETVKTLAGKTIAYSYTKANKPGQVTINMTAENINALSKGESIDFALPAQPGFIYDFGTFRAVSGLKNTSIAPLVSFEIVEGEAVKFTCQVLPEAMPRTNYGTIKLSRKAE